MPVLLSTDELQAGMCLYEPLVKGGRTLLASGKELTAGDISALQEHHPDAQVRVRDPLLDERVEFEDDSREREVAETVRRDIGEYMRGVVEGYSEKNGLRHVDFAKASDVVRDVVEFMSRRSSTVALPPTEPDGGPYLPRHVGNTFYLAMRLAGLVPDYMIEERLRQTELKGISRQRLLDLSPLGLGALFIDVGMLPVCRLYDAQRSLTQEEQAQVREHPNVGADLLPDSFPAHARVVVRSHHENQLGTGYPKRLPPERVHVFARIARVADGFDTATSVGTYRQARTPTRALWEMTCGPYADYYDPVLTEAFATLLQPFPIGAKLRLSDGRYAVVVRFNPSDPVLPEVVIAYDRQNRRLPAEQIEGPLSLADEPSLRLVSCGDEDLSYLYFEEVAPARVLPFHTLFDAKYP
ncbi:MAG: HD domain-containing phosphohydrolase [Phycisphaerae bacterium]